MNTKQKLTLGIAAIFMVTLTVIGVTYAYFVTRVNYTGTETQAVIETATIGSSFQSNDAEVVLQNAIPGQSVWKTFAVKSGSTSDVPFAINITTSLNVIPELLAKPENEGKTDWNVDTEALPKFIHTLADNGVDTHASITTPGFTVNDICYKESTTLEQKADCYKGSRYDNIEVTLYRVQPSDYIISAPSTLGDNDDFVKELITAEAVTGDENVVNLTTQSGLTIKASVVSVESQNSTTYAKDIKAPYNPSFSASSNAINIGGMQKVLAKASTDAPDSFNLYVLKVTYVNRNLNQNIENDASVNLKIDIDGTANITQ